MSDQEWRPVTVESPYAGNVQLNVEYARAAYHDCLVNHHEAPFASHLNYTQAGVLDDDDPEERAAGINAGLAIGKLMSKSVFYIDLGLSTGMRYGLEAALEAGRPVEFRRFSDGWNGRVSTTVDLIDAVELLKIPEFLQRIMIVNGDKRAGSLSPGCP